MTHRKMQVMKERSTFVERGVPESTRMHEVVVQIRLRNMDELERLLLEVLSNPSSLRFQKWLSFDEVQARTGNAVGLEETKQWLRQNGATVTWESVSGDFVKATASIAVWESMLKCKFFLWEDLNPHSAASKHLEAQRLKKKQSGGGGEGIVDAAEGWFSKKKMEEKNLVIQAKEYSLPVEMASHIEAIFYTTQTPPVMSQRGQMLTKDGRSLFKSVQYLLPPNLRRNDEDLASSSSSGSGSSSSSSSSSSSWGLMGSAPNEVTVSFLNELYQISSNIGSASNNQSVFETASEYFSPNDLLAFQNTFGLTQQKAISIGGYSTPQCSPASSSTAPLCTEGNLDIQYIMGISQATTSLYWYVEGGNPFVSFLTEISNMKNPSTSNSISWGATEQSISKDQLDAFNTQALKLAARGVTITVSSGDNGAPNDGGYGTCTIATCSSDSSSNRGATPASGNTWTGSGYFPSFPATSPYVVAVGATMGPEIGLPEVACQSNVQIGTTGQGGIITSGGGFSAYYAQPSWQKEAVNTYFAQFTGANAPAQGYNPLGRGFPDISFIGVKYQVIVDGQRVALYGTSASAPVMAGYVSLVNALRAKNNMSTIGYINPLLYQTGYYYNATTIAKHNTTTNPFNDVVSGSNMCCASQQYVSAVCCTSGFSTGVGWDPVTGWGSMNFPKFASIFSVAAPYSPPPPTFAPTYAPFSLTKADIVAIGVVVALCCCIIPISALVFLLRRRSRAAHQQQQQQLQQPVLTIQEQPFYISPTAQTQPQQQGIPVVYATTLDYVPPPAAARINNPISHTQQQAQFEACPKCRQAFADPVALVAHASNCRGR